MVQIPFFHIHVHFLKDHSSPKNNKTLPSLDLDGPPQGMAWASSCPTTLRSSLLRWVRSCPWDRPHGRMVKQWRFSNGLKGWLGTIGDLWGPLYLGGGTMSKKFSQLNPHEIPTDGGHLWNRWKSPIETGGDAGGRSVGLLDPAAGGEFLLRRLKRWEHRDLIWTMKNGALTFERQKWQFHHDKMVV